MGSHAIRKSNLILIKHKQKKNAIKKTKILLLILLAFALGNVAIADREEPYHPPILSLQASAEGKNVTLEWEMVDFLHTTVMEEDFNSGNIPAGWDTLDEDADGRTWTFADNWPSPDGLGSAIGSYSWEFSNKLDLHPDNWLVTPKLMIPQGGKLHYMVATEKSYHNETMAVYASESGTVEDFLQHELLKENFQNPIRNVIETNGRSFDLTPEWRERTIDLSEFQGKEIRLAFRHFETSGVFYVRLDNISVKGNSNATVPVHSFNIYRDGKKIANTTELSYIDEDAPYGNHKYEVEVQYEEGVSPKVAVVISVLNPDVVAYIHFEAHNVFGDGTGYQIFLDSNANQYGNAIPETSAMFTSDCNVPEDLPGKFSHSVPENAEMSCAPVNWVVDGKVVTEIPAGIYDFVVVNPLPGWLIRVASSPNGRRDNYEFIPNGHYYFQAVPDPYQPGADIIMIDAPTAIESVANQDIQAYAVDGGLKVFCAEPCEINLYDLYGRRIHTTKANEETFIACPEGIYVLQLKVAGSSKAMKLSVK